MVWWIFSFGLWTLSCRSSSLVSDGTWDPCIGSRVLDTGPPRNSHINLLLSTYLHHPTQFLTHSRSSMNIFWTNEWRLDLHSSLPLTLYNPGPAPSPLTLQEWVLSIKDHHGPGHRPQSEHVCCVAVVWTISTRLCMLQGRTVSSSISWECRSNRVSLLPKIMQLSIFHHWG